MHVCNLSYFCFGQSAYKRVEKKPQKLIQLSPRSHSRHLVGKRTAQKDAIKDITSDSQVNSNFPYRWSPDSLTINIYFYLFLYSYITRITIYNGTLHLKPLKTQNSRAALGRAAIKLLGGGGLQLVCGRPTFALSSGVSRTLDMYLHNMVVNVKFCVIITALMHELLPLNLFRIYKLAISKIPVNKIS